LITDKGFDVIAVEAHWPDAYRINQLVRFEGKDQDAVDALAGFQRFPAWMWRSATLVAQLWHRLLWKEDEQIFRIFYNQVVASVGV
jgi:erythromycin esterase-like protein